MLNQDAWFKGALQKPSGPSAKISLRVISVQQRPRLLQSDCYIRD